MGHAIVERVLLFGTRPADYIRASSHSGCSAMEASSPFENRPYTWLHPNVSLNVRFLLHRGRRPYMAHRVISRQRSKRSLSGVKRTRTNPTIEGQASRALRFAIQPLYRRGGESQVGSEVRFTRVLRLFRSAPQFMNDV